MRRSRAHAGVGGARVPDLEPDEAFARLWRDVAHALPPRRGRSRGGLARPGGEPGGRRSPLTGRRFDAVRLHGSGTDLTVGLLPSSVWHAADFTTVDGLRHFPNIPSEEIFTTPTRGAPTVTSPRRDRSRSTAR